MGQMDTVIVYPYSKYENIFSLLGIFGFRNTILINKNGRFSSRFLVQEKHFNHFRLRFP
jgi:hypothetical protein